MSRINYRTKGTLRFALKEPNAKDESPIQLIFSLGDSRVRSSVGYKVKPMFWDKKRQRVKNVINASNKDEINRKLNNLEVYIDECISNLKRSKQSITKYDVKSILNKFNEPEKMDEPDDFFSVFNRFILIKEKVLKKNRGNKSQTVQAYSQALNFLKSFERDTNYKVEFDTIDIDFYMEFVNYMQSIEKKEGGFYSLNTIGKHIKTLKTFLNYATSLGVNTNFKYKSSEFKITREQTTAVYLTKEEKKQLYDYDFSKHPDIEIARDIFLIGCEIGQRVSDYNDLNSAEIVNIEGKSFFKIKQKKTGEIVYCLLTRAVMSIMSLRHNSKPPKKITEQSLNKRIKKAARMAKINSKVKFERTEGGKLTEKFYPKYQLISSHSARRTFCSLLFNEGVPIQEIMIQSGHKSEREFKNYIRISKEEQVRKIVSSDKFNNSFIKVD